jgi:hypothetical protein
MQEHLLHRAKPSCVLPARAERELRLKTVYANDPEQVFYADSWYDQAANAMTNEPLSGSRDQRSMLFLKQNENRANHESS